VVFGCFTLNEFPSREILLTNTHSMEFVTV